MDLASSVNQENREGIKRAHFIWGYASGAPGNSLEGKVKSLPLSESIWTDFVFHNPQFARGYAQYGCKRIDVFYNA